MYDSKAEEDGKKKRNKMTNSQQLNDVVGCISEIPPAFVYTVLNFPINIQHASIFQMAPLSRDHFVSLSLVSQSKCRECEWLPLDKCIPNKQAIIQWGTIGMPGFTFLNNNPDYNTKQSCSDVY